MRIISRLLLLLVFFIAGCGNTHSPSHQVVIVSLDGLRAADVMQGAVPAWDDLAARGAVAPRVRTVLPPSPSPNWKTLLSGAGPEQHGVTSEAWDADRYILASTTGTLFPTLPGLIRTQHEGSRTALYHQWGGLTRLTEENAWTAQVSSQADLLVDAAVEDILSGENTLTVLQLDTGGDAETAQMLLSRFVSALGNAGLPENAVLPENTTLIVTAAYAGTGRNTSNPSGADIEVPWLVVGPGIAPGTRVERVLNSWDTAVTAAALLDVERPHVWRGRLLAEVTAIGAADLNVANGAEHVVIIGVDGMSPDGIRNADTPVLDSLIAAGAASMHARAVLTSSSSQNWASMANGAGPEQHGITSNGWERDDHAIAPIAASYENLFPGLFSVLRDAEPDAALVAVYDWGGFGRLIPGSILDVDVSPDGPMATARRAVQAFSELRPRASFIHLDHVDGAGHGYGHGSPEYYASVEEADEYIGIIMSGLREAGMLERTLVLISSDHGGRGTGHGGETMGEMEIPWIVTGPGVKKGHVLRAAIDTYDTPATALAALGYAPPLTWVGRPVVSAFEGGPQPNTPVPQFAPSPRMEPADGYFVDEAPTVALTASEGAVRYTLDGSMPTASSTLYEGPFTLTESAIVTAATFLDGIPGGAATGLFRIVPPGAPKPVRYRYYEGDFGGFLPDFERLTPVSSGMWYDMTLEALQGGRDSQFGAVYEATFNATSPGEYAFFLTSDDGSKLYVNGELVVDNDGDHGSITRSGTIELDKGQAQLRVEYFQGGGGKVLDVAARRPGERTRLLSFGDFEAGASK